MPCKNLKAELAREGISVALVAKTINKTPDTASNKINGTTEFTIEEAKAVRDTFFPSMTLEYLFAKEDK